MEIELQILPKDKTVFGVSYNAGSALYKNSPTVFHEVGIGIGILVLYVVFYKKGS